MRRISVSDLLKDSIHFEELMAMDGTIDVGKPTKENGFCLMGEEVNASVPRAYMPTRYVVTVTGKNQRPHILGCFDSHSFAVALLKEEFNRIGKGNVQLTDSTKKQLDGRGLSEDNLPSWFDIEHFFDKTTGARYDILYSSLPLFDEDSFAFGILHLDKNGVPVNDDTLFFTSYCYASAKMDDIINKAKKAHSGATYTNADNGTVTSITLNNGDKYYLTRAKINQN